MLKLSIGTSLVLATLAAALTATPSMAASRHMRATVSQNAYDAYAAVPGYSRAPAVIVDGKVIGADPDANVRLQLRKDAYTQDE